MLDFTEKKFRIFFYKSIKMEGLKLKLRGKCIHVYRHRRNQTWKSKGGEREKRKERIGHRSSIATTCRLGMRAPLR
jgi:hypothetical protein